MSHQFGFNPERELDWELEARRLKAPIFPVDNWSVEGEHRLTKHRYNCRDATRFCSEHRTQIDSILASCDVSNKDQAIRTVAILATTLQWVASHISKVTDHVIKNEAMYRRMPGSRDDAFSDLLLKADSGCKFPLQFKKMFELTEGLLEVFQKYSTDDLHPCFEHMSKLIPLRDWLRFYAPYGGGPVRRDIHGFRRPPYLATYKAYGPAASVKHYRDAVLPSFHGWAVLLRDLVLVFGIGKYSRSITLQIVKRSPPGSTERHKKILQLDQDDRAAKASVYEELKSESKYNMIVHDEWRRKHRHYPGNILIDLCPVETTLNEISNPEWMRAKMCRIETAHVTMDIFSPQCYDLSVIKFWDNTRFYFCPRRFPPPYDVNKMWDCESFDHLRWYIKHCSEKGCSPVYYNGGNEGLTRRFRCTRTNRNGKGCKFGFSVSCDMLHGYYITFHSSSRCKMSQLEHDCRGSLHDICQRANALPMKRDAERPTFDL